MEEKQQTIERLKLEAQLAHQAQIESERIQKEAIAQLRSEAEEEKQRIENLRREREEHEKQLELDKQATLAANQEEIDALQLELEAVKQAKIDAEAQQASASAAVTEAQAKQVTIQADEKEGEEDESNLNAFFNGWKKSIQPNLLRQLTSASEVVEREVTNVVRASSTHQDSNASLLGAERAVNTINEAEQRRAAGSEMSDPNTFRIVFLEEGWFGDTLHEVIFERGESLGTSLLY